MIKVIVETHSTKRDIYGNCYHRSIITNVRNSKSITVDVCSECNVVSILRNAGFEPYSTIHTVAIDTGMVRTSSLPSLTFNGYLDQCHYSKEWKKQLNGIGFRGLKRAEV